MQEHDSQKKIIIFAIISLVAALLSLFIFDFINTKKENIFHINKTYEDTLTKTRLHLSSIMNELIRDSSIQNNLKKGFKNSLQRTLLNKVRLGELDQINIYNNNCELLTFNSLNQDKFFSCSKPFKEGFSWVSKNKNISIVFKKRVVIDHKQFFFEGYTLINDSWLAINPQLEDLLKKNNLYLANKKKHVDSKEISHKKTNASSSLKIWSKNYLINLSLPLILTSKKIKNPFFYPLTLIALCILLLLLVKIKKQSQSNRQYYKKITLWCKELMHMNLEDIFSTTHSKIKEKNANDDDLYYIISKLIHSQLNIYQQDQKTKNKTKETGAQKTNHKNTHHSNIENSLLNQIHSLSSSSLVKISKITNNNSDLIDVLKNGSSKDCSLLLSHINEWLLGIERLGARKYFRSLYETDGHKEKSLLEEQIFFFKDLLKKIHSQIIYCLSVSSYNHENYLNILSCLNLWQAQITCNFKEEYNFDFITKETQQLLRTKFKSSQVFIQYNEDVYHEKNLNFCYFLWVSSLFHLISSMIEKIDMRKKLTVMIKLKYINNTYTMSLNIFDLAHTYTSLESKKRKEQLDLATKLLSQHKIKTQSILGLDKKQTLILEWKEKKTIKQQLEGRTFLTKPVKPELLLESPH